MTFFKKNEDYLKISKSKLKKKNQYSKKKLKISKISKKNSK